MRVTPQLSAVPYPWRKQRVQYYTLIHVTDSAPAQIYSKDVYDEHTRDDEQYLLEIAAEVRASGIAVEVALPPWRSFQRIDQFCRVPRSRYVGYGFTWTPLDRRPDMGTDC